MLLLLLLGEVLLVELGVVVRMEHRCGHSRVFVLGLWVGGGRGLGGGFGLGFAGGGGGGGR